MVFKVLMVIISMLLAMTCGRMQRTTAKGQLACDNKSVPRAIITLMEHDTFDPDDLLGKVNSDNQGYFEITGEEDEIGKIKPYLLIQHSCYNGIIDPSCTIVDKYPINSEYVDNIYEMGIVSLNIEPEERTKTCSRK